MKIISILIIGLFSSLLFFGQVEANEFQEIYDKFEIGQRLSDEFVLTHFGKKIVNEPMAWTVWKVKEKLKIQDVNANIFVVEVENAVGVDEYLYSLDINGNIINSIHLVHAQHVDEGCNDYIGYLRCESNVFLVTESCYGQEFIWKIISKVYRITEHGKIVTDKELLCKKYRKYAELSEHRIENVALDGLYKNEVMIMRNEIYAAHGYIFKSKYLNEYFNSMSWYIPDNSWNKINFNDIEKHNLNIISELENKTSKQE